MITHPNNEDPLKDTKPNPLIVHIILWEIGLSFFLFGFKEIIRHV